MGKVKVHELAKNMGLESKDLLAKLSDAGIDVASHSSSLAEEDLRKLEDFINPPKQKIEEALIKPGIIRRRRTVVREAVAESLEEADTVVSEPAVEEEKPARTAEVFAEEIQEPSIYEDSRKDLEVAVTLASEAPAVVETPQSDMEQQPTGEDKGPEVSEKEEEVVVQKAAELPEKVKPPVVAKATSDRAKILGRVELPQPSPPGQRKPGAGERPLRQDRKPAYTAHPAAPGAHPTTPGARPAAPGARPAAPGARPAAPGARPAAPGARPAAPGARPAAPGARPAAPGARPAAPGARPAAPGARPAAPSRGSKRVDPAPLAPMEQPFLEKEGRNKKRTKGRRSENVDAQDGLVSRRGRRVEVFEPGRAGQKKKRGGKPSKQSKQTEVTLSKAIKRVVRISDSITVGELAKRMGVKAKELIAELMRQGSMVTINHPLDYESAALLASEFNHEVENVAFDEVTILELEPAKEADDKSEDLVIRPPVVTIMGHVDHGKTSLLDAIREANVTAGEAGGITQHIGAYDVELDGRKVTFLDTPGHEAFTAMRARGAGVTDIVILVVAADDGVMPQTKEAISHSKAAGVPLIIAINKIDKPDANPERVKQELTEFELVPEEWGGDTIFVEVSAKQHTNLDTLLEMVLLQAEILELKANPNKRAKGSIVEARLDKGRGPVATVLVQDGTLKIGDAIVAGLHFGRVRSMISATGSRVKKAGPSFPVEVTGLGGVPNAGDSFHAVENEKAAKDVSQHRQSKQRETDLSKHSRVSLEQLFAKMQEGVVEELAIIIKADVQGSVEAVRDALEKLSTAACRLNVLHTGVGGISESDITLATASNAIVLGFNVRPESKAKTLADVEKVDIRLYSVIYDAVNDIRDAMEGLLAPTLKEKELGRVEVRDTFHVTRVGTIAGCYVVDGKIVRNAQTRLIRDNVVVWQGKLSSLKRFKDDAREVTSGYECGIGLEKFNDIKVGDIIEAFEIEEIKTSL